MKVGTVILLVLVASGVSYGIYDKYFSKNAQQAQDEQFSKKYGFYSPPRKGVWTYKGKKESNNSSTSASTVQNQKPDVSTQANTNDIDRVLSEWDNLANTTVKQYVDDKEQYFNHKDPDFFNGKAYRYGFSVKSMIQTAKDFYSVKRNDFSASQTEKLNGIFNRLDLLRQQINSDIGQNKF